MTTIYKIKNSYGYYFLVQKAVNFLDASSISQELGGKLVEFETENESQALWNAISSEILPELQLSWSDSVALDGGNSPYLWIGGTDQDTSSSRLSSGWNWQWLSSGQTIVENREEWGFGDSWSEPDDYQGAQHRLALALSGWPIDNPGAYGNSGQWNDLNAQNNLWFIAEIPRTFDIRADRNYVSEGEIFKTTIETVGVLEGAQIFWKISGDGINEDDFSIGNLTGIGVINTDGKFEIQHQLSINYDEKDEILEIELFADKLYQQPLFASEKVIIKDILNPVLVDSDAANSDEKFINILYENVVGIVPPKDSLDFWVEKLSSELESRESLIITFQNSLEYQNRNLKDVRIADLGGGSGVATKEGHEVLVKYTGKLENGFEFDSGSISFTLGENKVISGWEKGIPGMKVGDKRYLVIPSIFAYGEQELPSIPANSNLIFETEMLQILSLNIDGKFKDSTFYKDANTNTYKVKTNNGFDEITGIINLEFSDETININQDIIGTFDQVTGFDNESAEMFRLYNAAFARFPDSEGLAYWIKNYTSGVDDIRAIAMSFLASEEFVDAYGSNISNEDYVELLYQNVLNRDLDKEGYDYWVGNLKEEIETRYEVLIGFSESIENKALFSEMTGFY